VAIKQAITSAPAPVADTKKKRGHEVANAIRKALEKFDPNVGISSSEIAAALECIAEELDG
jgi:hypothetical protein